MPVAPARASVLCWGGAHQDIKIYCSSPVLLGCSNPASSLRSFGGVVRNVGENLAKLGLDVTLCTRLGKDAAGKSLLASIRRSGMSTQGVSFSKEFPTAVYTAILGPKGDLAVAAAEMEIYDHLSRSWVLDILEAKHSRSASVWVVDSNLPEATLHFLAAEKPETVGLWAVPASECKVKRLSGILSRLQGIVLNRLEIKTLSGKAQPKDGCRWLLDQGVKNIWLTDGAQGAYFCRKGEFKKVPIEHRVKARDVTGAGDAFSAAVIFASLSGKTGLEATRLGLEAAALTVQSLDSVAGGLRLKLEN